MFSGLNINSMKSCRESKKSLRKIPLHLIYPIYRPCLESLPCQGRKCQKHRITNRQPCLQIDNQLPICRYINDHISSNTLQNGSKHYDNFEGDKHVDDIEGINVINYYDLHATPSESQLNYSEDINSKETDERIVPLPYFSLNNNMNPYNLINKYHTKNQQLNNQDKSKDFNNKYISTATVLTDNTDLKNSDDVNNDYVKHIGSSAAPQMSSNSNQISLATNSIGFHDTESVKLSYQNLQHTDVGTTNTISQSSKMAQNLSILQNKSNQCCLPPYIRNIDPSIKISQSRLNVNHAFNEMKHLKIDKGTQTSKATLISRNNPPHVPRENYHASTSSNSLMNTSHRTNAANELSRNTSINMDSLVPTSYNCLKGTKCCGHERNSIVKKVTNKESNCRIIQKNKVDCSCDNWIDSRFIECEKNVACSREIGTSSCISADCVINKRAGCRCRYPPSFKQFSCTGKLSGNCDCNDMNDL